MPAEYADLEVFVAPPPADGKGLIRSGRLSDPEVVEAQDRRFALRSPVGLARLLRAKLGDELTTALFSGKHPLRASFREHPGALRSLRPDAERGKRGAPAVPPGYEALESAGLCVVTVHHPASRDAAVRFADEVRAMRADHELRRRLFGPHSKYVPTTIVVADLKDPRDAGRKKALARVRRALRASR